MARAALQGLAVLHHGLYGVCVQRAGETLGGALHALQHRNVHPVLGKVCIDMEHLLCLSLSLFLSGMGGVALLPKKLRRAEERTRSHLPTHDVAPLVAHDWQVAPRVNPVLVSVPNHRLRRRTYDERLIELGVLVHHDLSIIGRLETVVGHHGAFLGKTLHVFCLTGEEINRYEQWEVSVLHTRLLEHFVELGLHLLPNGIAVGLDNHTTTYRCHLCQVGLHHQVVVPLTVILSALGQLFQFFCHNSSIIGKSLHQCRHFRNAQILFMFNFAAKLIKKDSINGLTAKKRLPLHE